MSVRVVILCDYTVIVRIYWGKLNEKKNGTITLMKHSIPFRQLNSSEKDFVQILFQTKSSSRSINVDDSSDQITNIVIYEEKTKINATHIQINLKIRYMKYLLHYKMIQMFLQVT